MIWIYLSASVDLFQQHYFMNIFLRVTARKAAALVIIIVTVPFRGGNLRKKINMATANVIQFARI